MFHGRNLLKFHNLKNSGQTELTGTPSDKRKIPSLILQFGFNLSINVMQNLEVYKEHDIDLWEQKQDFNSTFQTGRSVQISMEHITPSKYYESFSHSVNKNSLYSYKYKKNEALRN